VAAILLTGAGFSRNWGGWLASEAFEYVIGRQEVGATLRSRLWKDKWEGRGFEETLGELQAQFKSHRRLADGEMLTQFMTALMAMYREMNTAFTQTQFILGTDARYSIVDFLARFGAIFTLNQDLLLERHYLPNGTSIAAGRRFSGAYSPGLEPWDKALPCDLMGQPWVVSKSVDPIPSQTKDGMQPYFKLHGSSNWVNKDGTPLLVLGGSKSIEIDNQPLLRWYQDQFNKSIQAANAKLMIIGYSFGDKHINDLIQTAATRGQLKIFIIDPAGADILDKSRRGPSVRGPVPVRDDLSPAIWGASRRTLREIFGGDGVEYAKITRFIDD
jgi:hypothetical protein